MRRIIRLFITLIVILIAMMSVSYAQNQWNSPSELKMETQQNMKGEGGLMVDDYITPFISVLNKNFNNKATFHLYSVCDINNYPYPYFKIGEEHLGSITTKNSPYLMTINLQDETHIILTIYKGIGERYDLNGIPFYRSHQLIDEFHSVGITDDEVVKELIDKLLKLK